MAPRIPTRTEILELLGSETRALHAREIAARLRDALPETYVARFGGDEFVLLRCEDVVGNARATAAAAAAAFAAPFWVAGKPVYLTASIGVVACVAADASTDELLRRADQAMYDAKKAGKDRVVQVEIKS